jgi:hypothetical protein
MQRCEYSSRRDMITSCCVGLTHFSGNHQQTQINKRLSCFQKQVTVV